MQKILTAEEMREVDRQTSEKYGIPSLILMENAAHAAARAISEKFEGNINGKTVLVLCGKGNNGGDGAALARILWTLGADVVVYLFGKVEDTKGDARINFELLKKLDPIVFFWEIDDPMDLFSKNLFPNTEIVIDAIFGTGLTRSIEGDLKGFIESCQEQGNNSLFVSLDIPSGLNSDLSDTIYEHINADLTITFTAPKPANVLSPAYNYNGQLIVAKIGSPQELIDGCPSQLFISEKADAQKWLTATEFTSDSYKNKRGSAILVAGSKKYAGAAVLSANACLQTGVGLLSLATPNSGYHSISSRLMPEVMCSGFSEDDVNKALEEVLLLCEKVDVVGIGCGLYLLEQLEEFPALVNWGNKKENLIETNGFINELIKRINKPLVIDAEGLNALSPFNLIGKEEHPIVLTPHEGEFLRLLGIENRSELANRVEKVREFSQKHNVILVLKGERTLIGSPDGKVVVNQTGNSGLGKGGNGDTLTGIITGFIAQSLALENVFHESFTENSKMDLVFEAVVAAVFVAGMAGDIAFKKIGKRAMRATNVSECLVEAMNSLESDV